MFEEGFALMAEALVGIRRAGFSAVCALLLTCAWVPVARARQSSTPDAATKPATAKASTRKRHKRITTASTSTKSASSTHTASTRHHSSRRKKSARSRGQQKIDSERVQAIQEALIREHYLSGEATGKWNQASEEAMRRYQGDHGWQTKTVPDSRALIKLGLGPSNDHLLNPESAMITKPDAPRAEPVPVTPQTVSPATSPAAPTADPAPSANHTDSSRPQ